MVSTRFRDPQALSSALALLRTLQPWAFGSLNRVDLGLGPLLYRSALRRLISICFCCVGGCMEVYWIWAALPSPSRNNSITIIVPTDHACMLQL